MKCTNNGNLFISTYEGLFKSTDLGNSFQSLSNNSTILTTIVNENHIFSYLNNYIIVYSSDNGNNWIYKNYPVPNESPTFFEADKKGWLYLGTEYGNLYLSKDKAASWNKIYDHPWNTRITKINFSDSTAIYIAIETQGVYKSTDDGETWNEFILPNSGGWGSWIDFVFSSDGDVFVSDMKGFYHTDNQGVFLKKRIGWYLFYDLEIDKFDNIFMSGTMNVFKSTDRGNTWYPLINNYNPNFSGWMNIIIVDSLLFAGNDNILIRNIIKPGVIPNTIGKNYFPTRVGNSYMFRNLERPGMTTTYISYDKDYINADSLIQGEEYFNHTKYGWVRYSEDVKKLYKYSNGTETVMMDFNYPEGTLISRLEASSIEGDYVQIVGGNISPFTQFHSKGFTAFGPEGSYSHYFTENIGYSRMNVIDHLYGYFDANLIQCISTDTLGNPFIIDYTHNPQILFQPITSTKDSIISFQFTVKHNYSAACSVLLGTNNFIETVTMEGFYTNDVDTTDFTPINGMNLHCTLEYVITTPINLDKLKSGYKLYYRLTSKDKGMMPHYGYSPNVSTYHTIKFDTTNSINITDEIPNEFALYQNYPNPFNPSTELKFSIPTSGNVKLVIYNQLGEVVTELVNDYKGSGVYTYTWHGTSENGSKVASGVYFYQLITSGKVLTNKMILQK
jgi:hypothetical protein